MSSSVAVIIVNYATADLAIAAVDSVLSRQHGSHPVAVHVVDNASPNGDAAVLAKAHAARDWEGRVTGVLKLDALAIAMAVDPDDRTLYAIRLEPQPSIVRYTLPGSTARTASAR